MVILPFGSRIRAARKSKGLRQEELANLIGVSTSSVTRWENDEREPTVSFVKLISERLEVPIEFFFGLTEDIRAHTPKKLIQEGVKWIPLLSHEAVACCGDGCNLAEVTMNQESLIAVPESGIGHSFDDMRPVFSMRTEGDSMQCAGIEPGATIIVNPAEDIPTGKIALAKIGDSLMVKRVQWKSDGGVALLSDGPSGHRLDFSKDDIESGWISFLGRVTGSFVSM